MSFLPHPSTITQPSNRLASHNRLAVLRPRRAHNRRRALKRELDASLLPTRELDAGACVRRVQANPKANGNVVRVDSEAATQTKVARAGLNTTYNTLTSAIVHFK